MNQSWDETLDVVLSETDNVHRLYSRCDGFCFLTAHNGARYEINDRMNMDSVTAILEQVKRINQRCRYF